MATSTQARTVDQRETSNLIGSDKVEGTPVYRLNGDHIGQIERVMIDKISGKVAYAVMSFGGFLGIGEDYYPLPWSVLTYNPTLGGYEVEITDQQLKGAPKYSRHESWDWSDRQRTQKLTDYYGGLG
jgi:PRC-barrel domain